MKKIVTLLPIMLFAFFAMTQNASAAQVGEDITSGFAGTLSGTQLQVVPSGNGKVQLEILKGPGTYATGGTGFLRGLSVATNAAGDIYSTGNFSGAVDFNTTGSGSPDIHTDVGIFITKINADGSYGYTYTMGGPTGYYNKGNAITTNTAGNIYITGVFRGTVDFNTTGSGSPDSHTSNGDKDIFLTKINANGSYGYTYTMGDSNPYGRSSIGNAITTNTAGDIYITGGFSGTVNFNTTGPTPADPHTSKGGTDIFITKINADGTYGYTYTMGGMDNNHGNGITTDVAGNVYITGEFSGTVNFNTTGPTPADPHTSNGQKDIFLTKINADGTYGYTYTMGSNEQYSGGDIGNAIATNTAGDIYITGEFSGTVNFNTTGPTPSDPHTSNGISDIFITKINADGTYGYTYTMGGSDPHKDRGTGDAIAINTAGDIYITGGFSNSVDFDPTTGTDLHTDSGNQSIFLTKINADKSYGYTYTMGGGGYDRGRAIAINACDMYIVGSFGSTGEGSAIGDRIVDFDPTSGTELHSPNGHEDGFLSKYNTCDDSYGGLTTSYIATGTYQTLISPPLGFTSWGTLTLKHNTPTGTTISYEILDRTCSIPLMQETSATTVDLSSISAKDHAQICLVATLTTTDPTITPQIEKWSASFSTSPPQSPTKPVYRFWSNMYRAHFYTASEQEKNALVAECTQDMWRLEGVVYNAVDKNTPNATPVYRFWSEKYEHHFYTASEAEKAKVIANYPTDTWRYEGVPYYVHSTTTVTSTPVYRFWSEEYKGHFYTASETEKDFVIANYPDHIWHYEGVAWYVEK